MIREGQTVNYGSDPEPGTVTEIWRGQRAYVRWASGMENWVPIRSLTPTFATARPSRRDCDCPSAAHGGPCTCC